MMTADMPHLFNELISLGRLKLNHQQTIDFDDCTNSHINHAFQHYLTKVPSQFTQLLNHYAHASELVYLLYCFHYWRTEVASEHLKQELEFSTHYRIALSREIAYLSCYGLIEQSH